MIILLCGRDQCGLNAHSVDPDSMRIESNIVFKETSNCWSNILCSYVNQLT